MKRGAAQITVPNVPTIRIFQRNEQHTSSSSMERKKQISPAIIPRLKPKHSLPATCHPTQHKCFSFYKVIEPSPNSLPSKKDEIFIFIPEAFDSSKFKYVCVNSILDLQFKTDKSHIKFINLAI